MFYFHGRNKRPPLDYVNAMLPFGYSLLAGMCGAALEAVGLDPYVGFFYIDRPGRMSLALDLMEEFRSVMVDRFVLTLINKKIMTIFKCQMDAAKCRQVKNILENLIDKDVDSLRFYYLGEKYKNKVEHIGAKPGFDVTETLIL